MENLSEAKNPEAVFHIHAVTKIYQVGEVEVRALNGVDLDLFKGEFVVLLGPSGSGKSTLLNILGGLDVPTDGEVFYFDHNLSVYDDKELTRFRREHVGFVFQFYNLIPSLTALENVALVAEIAENPMDSAEALNLVDLGDRLHHFPAQLPALRLEQGGAETLGGGEVYRRELQAQVFYGQGLQVGIFQGSRRQPGLFRPVAGRAKSRDLEIVAGKGPGSEGARSGPAYESSPEHADI